MRRERGEKLESEIPAREESGKAEGGGKERGGKEIIMTWRTYEEEGERYREK